MSLEKYIEQDFQALETSFSKSEPLSDVALPRILENISKLDDADRIYHWHEELRRIGGLPPVVTESAPIAETEPESTSRFFGVKPKSKGGVGGKSK